MTVLLVSYMRGPMSRVSEKAKPLSLKKKKIWWGVLLQEMLTGSVLPHYTNANSRMYNMEISSKYMFPVQKCILLAERRTNLLYSSSAQTHLHFLVTISVAQTTQIFQNRLLKLIPYYQPLFCQLPIHLWVIMLSWPESQTYSFKKIYICMQAKLAIFCSSQETWVLPHDSPR